ncbi:ABC transporter substrate-binding protein [Pseudoroseomonas cervicalis]|uniref:ABC transporter substrate-binding protein n=1 Tax=Teichococcus cervicalis TaxID=204525 RepID=UPI0022F1933F|nr:ABC transporter substrate-binding protein [Pseudoroseomonas cervicalis]WBV42317.1 ABC transporter substrate-binding protein [Pseudoroseomonas cervicalis]
MPLLSRLCGLLAACALLLGAATAEAEPIRLRDVTGQEIILPTPARRVVLGEGRFFHAVNLLERQDPTAVIAGWMGDFVRLDPAGYRQLVARFPAAAEIPTIGASTAESFSVERVLALRPDLVVLSADGGHAPGQGSDVVEQFRRAGVPVLFIDFRTAPMANTAPSLRLLGQALGRAREAEEFLAYRDAHLARIRDALAAHPGPRPRVLLDMLASSTRPCCHSAGRGNLGEFVEFAGGDNIGARVIPGALGPLNLEYVLTQDPAYYIATGSAGAADNSAPLLGAGVDAAQAASSLRGTTARTGIAGLGAVRQGHAAILWHHFYNSPYNLLAIEAIAHWIHPELFGDLDPAATQAEMNARFLAVPLEGLYWAAAAPAGASR